MKSFYNETESMGISGRPPSSKESGRKKWGTAENCKKLSCGAFKEGGSMMRSCEAVCDRIFRD